jgi:hypothetical protein
MNTKVLDLLITAARYGLYVQGNDPLSNAS